MNWEVHCTRLWRPCTVVECVRSLLDKNKTVINNVSQVCRKQWRILYCYINICCWICYSQGLLKTTNKYKHIYPPQVNVDDRKTQDFTVVKFRLWNIPSVIWEQIVLIGSLFMMSCAIYSNRKPDIICPSIRCNLSMRNAVLSTAPCRFN